MNKTKGFVQAEANGYGVPVEFFLFAFQALKTTLKNDVVV